jgi:hypothetical protein
MAVNITTTITSTSNVNTNIRPIPYVVTFSAAISDLEIHKINVTGGTVVRLLPRAGNLIWDFDVSPTNQGGACVVSIPANTVTGPSPTFHTNIASNTITRNFLSIQPKANILHDIPPINNSKRLRFLVTFESPVSGFDSDGLGLVNCKVLSIDGSGETYTVTISPLKTGNVEVYVKAGAGIDAYGNFSVKSNTLIFSYDPTAIDEKRDIVYGEIDDESTLLNFDVTQLKQVASIQTLADCAKTLPQRLLDMATQKALDIIRSNEDVKKLAALVTVVQSNIELVKTISDNIKALKDDPETFLSEVLAAQGLTGNDLIAKIETLTTKYAALNNINELIDKAMTSGICGQKNFYADGSPAPKPSLVPSDVLPREVPGVVAGVSPLVTYDTSAKDNYDAFIFQLKEHVEIDSIQEQNSERAKMISVVTTLTMGYHDQISRTTDNSSDSSFHDAFVRNVENELTKNGDWPNDIKESYKSRTSAIGTLIRNNADVIRAFYNRNSPTRGKYVSVGITTYSGPDADFTTFLDIRPSERPPELAQMWKNKGFNIPAQEAKLKARGIKTGTLPYSYAFKGAYGALESDRTCASSRFPGGSVIMLKKPDGTIYDPTGRNPSGLYKVTDTGNTRLTYNKPDIYTSTPEKYSSTESVQVFLVSRGTQEGPRYRAAQKMFGNRDQALT